MENKNNKINKINVKKNKINISLVDNFNSLITDIISNIKNKNNNYIQDDIFKEILSNFNNINNNIIENDNYLVYKGGNTTNEIINNFLNNNLINENENEKLIKLKEEYKLFIKKELDTSKRSDIDFNYNVSFKQSKNLDLIKNISNILYDLIKNNQFDNNLHNIINSYIYDYNLYLNIFENELKKIYNNNDVEIIGLYCGKQMIYNKYDYNFNNLKFNKYNNDENYIKIKNNYSNIYINKENVNIDDIIKLKNIIISYDNKKLYNTSFNNFPENYDIIINEENIINEYPFVNSLNDTLYFKGCNLKNVYS